MTLPLLLSVPHAGLSVPDELAELNKLTEREIAEDGDEGAAEIYMLDEEVATLVRTDVARAFVDMNRAEDDRRKDGVIKTHTCWDVPIYRRALTDEVARGLLDAYWRPYHERLSDAGSQGLLLAVDCHTMAASGPPVGPDPGQQRPAACLSNADGTCPQDWIESLRELLQQTLGADVLINEPFRGGYITSSHSAEMPWVQLELSRGPFASVEQKKQAVLDALTQWCSRTG